MNPNKLAVTLTIAAGWLSFNSLIILMYYLLRSKGVLEGGMSRGGKWLMLNKTLSSSAKTEGVAADKRQASSSTTAIADGGAVEASTDTALPAPLESKEVIVDDSPEESTNHVLFVTFEQPGIELNRQLQLVLQKWEAHYDSELQIYNVPGVTPQNPLLVTNAYPPGVMPSIASFQQEAFLISGVSVILKKPKRKRGFDKVQLEKFVTFAQALAELGGSLRDAKRQVATVHTFHAIRHQ